jgi:hypothetical protein
MCSRDALNLPKVLCLDDKVLTIAGRATSFSSEIAYQFSQTKRFEAIAPPMISWNGSQFLNPTLDEILQVTIGLIIQYKADAVVMDANWFKNEWFGLELWKALKRIEDFTIPDTRVVFISTYFDEDAIDRYCQELGIHRDQCVFRSNAEGGYRSAICWLTKQFT